MSPRLVSLENLPLTSTQLLREAAARASKMSIGGAQPKLSVILRIKDGRLEVVDLGGRFILKPESPNYPELPANEDVSMRMAGMAGLRVPDHGMVWTADNQLCYFVRRFDRIGRKDKVPVEDFGQLLGLRRDDKYEASVERLVKVVDDFCTFPLIEKEILLRSILVSFLLGNEDAHVKNYSLITGRDRMTRLSPSYDVLNSTIAMSAPTEESALPLAGKKANLQAQHFLQYLGEERMGLPRRVIDSTLNEVARAQPTWDDLLARSFLSEGMKYAFANILADRRERLEIS